MINNLHCWIGGIFGLSGFSSTLGEQRRSLGRAKAERLPPWDRRVRFLVDITIFFVCLLSLAGQVRAAAPYLVKNIVQTSTPNSSSPTNLTVVGSTLYFTATEPAHGTELWKTDGTQAGTTLIADRAYGGSSSSDSNLMNFNGTLYFVHNDPATRSYELWKSDGTASGTSKQLGGGIQSINLLAKTGSSLFFYIDGGQSGQNTGLWKTDGTSTGISFVAPVSLGIPEGVASNNLLFFFDYSNQLWRSDGTYSGTFILKQFDYPSSISNLTDVDGTVFFLAVGANGGGKELWKSDGTVAGTMLVKTINPGPGYSIANQLTNVSGILYFNADDGVHGQALWKSDGTATGTTLVKNVVAYGPGTGPVALTNVNGTLFFAAYNGYNGPGLWKTDGTDLGTVLLTGITPHRSYLGSYPGTVANVNGVLYFADSGGNGLELWKSDGTASGTVVFKNIPVSPLEDVSSFTNINGTLYFVYNDPATGKELWKTDGTAAGTVLVKDIWPGGSASPSNFASANGNLYFFAESGHGLFPYTLWKSDGTTGGTVPGWNLQGTGAIFAVPSPSASPIVGVNGKVFYGNGTDLWVTDGTPAGLINLTHATNEQSFDPQNLTNVNGTVYFTTQYGLRKSDGTTGGTSLVKSFKGSPPFYSPPYFLTNVSGVLYFFADDGTHGPELWTSNGTGTGTTLVKDLVPGTGGQDRSMVSNMVGLNSWTLFTGGSGGEAINLWKTNGTANGTTNLTNFNQNDDIKVIGTGASECSQTNPCFSTLNGVVMFSVWDCTHNPCVASLWRSDGTAAGTSKLMDGVIAIDLLVLNGKWYFNGPGGLWTSDGTGPGTVLIKAFKNWDYSHYFQNNNLMTAANGKLFFPADDGVHGVELWMSDGTPTGTVLVSDLFPGSGDSNPVSLYAVGNRLYFTAYTDGFGRQLWALDTTSISSGITTSGSMIVVSPNDPVTGNQVANITFSSVSSSGLTTVTSGVSVPTTPSLTAPCSPAVTFDVSTSATFSGSATVCVTPSQLGSSCPSGTNLYHWNGAAWDKLTPPTNSPPGQICGVTTSLSPFTLLAPQAQEPQTITFAVLPNLPLGSNSLALSATASSGLTVTFSSLTPSVCAVMAGVVTLNSTGTCTIAADQSGDDTYAAAPEVLQSFQVTPTLLTQTISFAAVTNHALGSSPVTVSATASSGLIVTVTSLTNSTCSVSGTSVMLLSPGACVLQASQAGNDTYAAATPVSRSFNISASGEGNSTVDVPLPAWALALLGSALLGGIARRKQRLH